MTSAIIALRCLLSSTPCAAVFVGPPDPTARATCTPTCKGTAGGGGGHIAIVTEFVSRTVDVSGPVTQVEALVPLELAPQALEWYQVGGVG